MKINVIDTQENNNMFSIEAVHFLRLSKAFKGRFIPADDIGKKLLKEVPDADIDIGTTKIDEDKWKATLENASEQKRIDQLEKVVAEKVAVITGKIPVKKATEVTPEPQTETEIDLPALPFSKKELDQMDLSQLSAIYNEIFPNKNVPKSKKEIIAEILQ